jgi:hypothetical protein
MLATFCLRLAFGMIAALLLLSPKEVNSRFFRTHFLVALGLVCLAWILAFPVIADDATLGSTVFALTVRWLVFPLVVFCCLGSISWSLEGHPGSRVIGIATAAILMMALALRAAITAKELGLEFAMVCVGELASAALLGAAVTAMLLGHFYLIAPGMSLSPLLRMLTVLFIAIAVRLVLAGWGLWSWAGHHSILNMEDETVLWLPVRWGLGFLGPLIFGWMARSAARIRSTQSATGILYVVVIFCFLGELTSQLLTANTGYLL